MWSPQTNKVSFSVGPSSATAATTATSMNKPALAQEDVQHRTAMRPSDRKSDISQYKNRYCSLVMRKLFDVFGISPQTFQACEFPLVCPCRMETETQQPSSSSSTSIMQEQFLQIHPRLLDQNFSLSTLPFVDLSASVEQDWIDRYDIKELGHGTYGKILTLPSFENNYIDNGDADDRKQSYASQSDAEAEQENNYQTGNRQQEEEEEEEECVVKIQLIRPTVNKYTNGWTAPLVEFEQNENCYVTLDFISEALALYALSRYETETQQAFFPGQTKSVPRIYYSTIIVYKGHYYSVLVIEKIQNAKTLSALVQKKVSPAALLKLLQKLSIAYKNTEECVLHFHNQDIHGGNILYQRISGHLYMIDFGACMITLPLAYVCGLLSSSLACIDNGIPIKTKKVVPFQLPGSDQLNLDFYNFSALIYGLSYHYSRSNSLQAIAALLSEIRTNAKKYNLPSMESHQSKSYRSEQFKMTLLKYELPDNISLPCTSHKPSGCQNNKKQVQVLFENHNTNKPISDTFMSSNRSTMIDTILQRNPDTNRTLYSEFLIKLAYSLQELNDPQKSLAPILSYIQNTIFRIHKLAVEHLEERALYLQMVPDGGTYITLPNKYGQYMNAPEGGLHITTEQWIEYLEKPLNDIIEILTNVNILHAVSPKNINRTLVHDILAKIHLFIQTKQVLDDIFVVHYWLAHHHEQGEKEEQQQQQEQEQLGQEVVSCILL